MLQIFGQKTGEDKQPRSERVCPESCHAESSITKAALDRAEMVYKQFLLARSLGSSVHGLGSKETQWKSVRTK